MQLRGTGGMLAAFCALVLALGLTVISGGCGGDSSGASAGSSAEAGIPDSPPKLEPPPFLPPRKLVFKDLGKGTGTEAKKGDEVALQYDCIVWGSGVEYASSWRYPSPPHFVLGERARLLRGLNFAVPGMREGGGREVQVPSTLLYYPGVSHPPVRRLDALLCKVYLVDVVDKKQK
jgi:peptidylprolyl isomerase